jgi:hypothetical protein
MSRDNFLLTFFTVRLKEMYVLDSLLIVGYQEMLIYFIRFPARSVLVSIASYFNAVAFDYRCKIKSLNHSLATVLHGRNNSLVYSCNTQCSTATYLINTLTGWMRQMTARDGTAVSVVRFLQRWFALFRFMCITLIPRRRMNARNFEECSTVAIKLLT